MVPNDLSTIIPAFSGVATTEPGTLTAAAGGAETNGASDNALCLEVSLTGLALVTSGEKDVVLLRPPPLLPTSPILPMGEGEVVARQGLYLKVEAGQYQSWWTSLGHWYTKTTYWKVCPLWLWQLPWQDCVGRLSASAKEQLKTHQILSKQNYDNEIKKISRTRHGEKTK